MLTRSFFALFIVVLRQNIHGALLGCYVCENLLTYTYIMTAETVPVEFLRKCAYRMSQRSCSINVQIDLDKKQTILNVTSSTDYVETSIAAVAGIENGLKHKRYVSFWCSDSQQACNTEKYLKRVMQSITFNGSFEELEPLLTPTNQTVDYRSCLVFSNTTTTECQTKCNEDSKACYIASFTDTAQSSEVCARCSSMDDYHLTHSTTFFINNLSMPQSDSLLLSCAVPQCSSFTNLKRIRQLVTINFNATSFFDITTTIMVSSTSTTTISSGSTIWNNKMDKHLFLFNLFMISLIYDVMLF